MQKLKGKAKQIVLAVTAVLFVMGVVCNVVINSKNNAEVVSNETPIKVKVLGITENAESAKIESQENGENLEEGEEAETKEVSQIATKSLTKADANTQTIRYANSSKTITLALNGTDNLKVQNAGLTANNIVVKVGGTAVNPTTKTLSEQADLNDGKNGKTYVLTLSGIPGDGDLSISIPANTITDHVGNKNGVINSIFDDDTRVIMDNTAPTKPTCVGRFVSGGATYTSGTWANSQVNTTISTTEAGSGVAEFQVSTNQTSWTKLSLSAGALSNDGTTWSGIQPSAVEDGRTYSLYIRAIDNIGNISPISDLYTIKYDTTAPTISLSLGTDGYASSIPVNVTVNDTHSSIVSTKYAKGNQNVAYFASNGTNVVNNTFNTTENGIYTVFAQDEAGNSAVSTITVEKIDKTNPTIIADDEFNGGSVIFIAKDIAPDDNEVPSGVNSYKITDSNTAPTSGWTEVEVPEVTLVDGKQQISNRVVLTNTHLSVGTHYIWVKDRAGHTASKEISIYYTITLDNQDATTPGTTSVKADSTTLSNITTPSKTGKSFGGYYTQIGGAGTKYYNANGTSACSNNFTEDTTLYAQWNSNTVTVNVTKNGSAWANSEMKVALYLEDTLKYETTSSGSGVTTAVFSDVTNGTYKVYAGKSTAAKTDLMDTGARVTINNDSKSGNIYYVDLTLVAGTGISSVSGAGTYLYNILGNQQEIPIDAIVTAGYTWSTWTITSGSLTAPTTPEAAAIKSQNVKVGAGAITLTASATYTATPVITRSDYNTFTYTADSGAAYYVSTSDSAPTNANAQDSFAFNKWTTATNTGNLTLTENTTYYVWTKDAATGGNISSNYATIAVRKVVKTQGTGTTLSIRYDTPSGPQQTSGNGYVLDGTTIWMTAVENSGYSNVALLYHDYRYPGYGEKNASGDNLVVSADVEVSSNAIANKATITINKDGSAWANSGIKVALYKNGTKKYEATSSGSGVTNAEMSPVANDTYDVYAGKSDGAKTDLIDTGLDITINNNTPAGTINYYTLTLNKGTGISAVSGAGVYLYKSSGTQQEIEINATVAAGFSWNTWSKTEGTGLATFTAGTQNQNIKLGHGAVTLQASATYTATPVITREDYNTFSYSADNASKYFVSPTQSTKPESGTKGWTSAINTGDLTLAENTTYYVWAKAGDQVSPNSATIAVRKIVKNQGEGTNLTVKYDTTDGTSGSDMDGDNLCVLHGTPIWARATANSGYHDVKLYKGETEITGAAGTFNAENNETLTSSATANTVTITIKKDNSAWVNSGINVALYQGNTKKYEAISSGADVIRAIITGVENGNYDVYASKNDGAKTELIDTGVDISVSNNNTNANINYGTVTLVAGAGISEVSGGGIYLFVMNGGTQQNIAIDATVSAGFSWSTWTKTAGTTPATYTAGTKNQNIKLGEGPVTLTANATYTARPDITRQDFNTFTYTADSADAYYVSTSNSKPSSATAQGTFALNKWTTATSTGNLTLTENTTYYVWAKAGNIISDNSATIAVRKIVKDQGTGSILTIKYDTSVGNSGTEQVSGEQLVLDGTPIWMKSEENSGYHDATLVYSDLIAGTNQDKQATGDSCNVTSNIKLTSAATANTVTITINKDDSAWANSGIKVALYKNGAKRYEATSSGSGVTTAVMSPVENDTYDVYANSNGTNGSSLINTGLQVTIQKNNQTGTIDYYTLTMTAGTGISAVSGAGVYLYNNGGTQQDISIGATVAAGYTWNRWTYTGKSPSVFEGATVQNQTIKMGKGAVILTANATYVATPTITRMTYNTIKASAEGATKYFISGPNDSTAPVVGTGTWINNNTTSSAISLTKDAVYRVWVQDGNQVSPNYATISAWEIEKTQGIGTTLTMRYDSTSSSTGTELSGARLVVLNGTPMWAKATLNSGYRELALKHGETSMTASGESFNVTVSEAVESSAKSNKVTIKIRKNDNYWENSQVEIQLLKNNAVKYFDVCEGEGVSSVEFDNVENGTYQIFANSKQGDRSSTIYTGTDLTINNNDVTKYIDYYVLTLDSDSGISSVSGSGVYLFKSSGTQQDIAIDAEVKEGYVWNNWSKNNGLNPTSINYSTKSQNIKMSSSYLGLKATTNYMVTPTITLVDRDTFSVSADNAAEYYINTTGTQPLASESGWRNILTDSGNLSLSENTTYYVWVKDTAGQYNGIVSSNYATISVRKVTKSQGYGTTLTTRMNATSSTTGSAWGDTPTSTLALEGTQIWAFVSSNAGYDSNSRVLLENTTQRPVNGYTITVGNSNVTISSSASYTATPTITRVDYNTFSVSGTGADKYAYTRTPTAPTSSFTDINQDTGNLSLTNDAPYYVWIRDKAGVVSPNYAVINAYRIAKSQGTGSTLTVRYDATSSSTGTLWSTSASSNVVLEGTPFWAKAEANTGYHDAKLYHGSTEMTASGSSFVASANEEITSTAIPNTYTIVYNGNGATGGSTPNSTHTYDSNHESLNVNGYTKTGNVFEGWAESSTGNVVYRDGQPISNLVSTNNGTKTLYAKWVAVNIAYKYSIYPDTNNTLSYANSLGAAYNLAKTSGSTITMLQDVTESTGATLKKSFTFDTNGKTLTLGSYFGLANGYTVDVTGSGTVTGGTDNPFKISGTLNVNGATIQSTTSKSAIYMGSGATVNVNSGTVQASSGKGIEFAGAGTLTVNGGTVSSSSSYAILNLGTLNINGGTVSSTSQAAIYQNTNSSASTTVTGGTISGGLVAIGVEAGSLTIGNNDGIVNTESPILKTESTSNYGAVYVASGKTFNFYDGRLGSKSSYRPLHSSTSITGKPSGYGLINIGLSNGYYWGVLKQEITAPTETIYKPYTGSTVTGVTAGTGYTVVSGGTGTAPGAYTATLRLSDTSSTVWSDGTTADKTVTWYITKIDKPSTIYLKASSKNISFTKSTYAGDVSVSYISDSGVIGSNPTVSGNVLTLTGVNQGTTNIRLKENNGNYETDDITVIVDTSAPTVEEVTALIYSSSRLDVTATGVNDDGGSGIASYIVTNNSGTQQASGSSATVSCNNIGWYSNNYKMKIVDVAGNESPLIDISYYKVNSVNGLTGLAAAVNNNGDFSGRTVKQIADITANSTITSIGTSTKSFAGTYDAKKDDSNNYKISGLTYSSTTGGTYALFYKNSGTIQNLTVQGENFDSTGGVAGIVYTNNGTIFNCTNSGSTLKGEQVSGIACNNNGTIESCKILGTTTFEGTQSTGGITASNNGTVNDCSISGSWTINGGSQYNGGIAAYNASGKTISNCRSNGGNFGTGSLMAAGNIVGYNAGNINTCSFVGMTIGKTSSSIGGIAGNNSGRVSNCSGSNTMKIARVTNLGGIVGQNDNGIVEDCVCGCNFDTYSSTSSQDREKIGKIVGYNSGTTTNSIVRRCYATGEFLNNLFGKDGAGGIVGYNSGTVTLCFNTGTTIVRNVAYVGGVVGYNTGEVSFCYNTNTVDIGAGTGSATPSKIGGIAGYNNSVIKYVYNIGQVGDTVSESWRAPICPYSGSYTQCYYINSVNHMSSDYGDNISIGALKTIMGKNSIWEANFEVDYSNLNNYYPILQWYANKNGKAADSSTVYGYKQDGNASSNSENSKVAVTVTTGTSYVYIPQKNTSRTFTVTKSGNSGRATLYTNASTVYSVPYTITGTYSGTFLLSSSSGSSITLTSPSGYSTFKMLY